MRHLAILGSTGSIGTSTLDVVAAHPDRLTVGAMAAGCNRDLFRAQCERYRPDCVSLARAEDAAWLASELSYRPVVLHGMDGLGENGAVTSQEFASRVLVPGGHRILGRIIGVGAK